jgi:multidrug resistance efflux pump
MADATPEAAPVAVSVPGVPAQAVASRRGRGAAIVTGAGAIVGLAAIAWLRIAPAPERTPLAGGRAQEQAVTVASAATATTITLIGTVGPGKTIAALAPFDGVVRERRAQLGALVGDGEILLVMDAGEIESRLREAQAAALKGAMAVDLLDRWATGPDVIRAQRAKKAAEASLAVIERQVTETKRLLDRGIVSRNEYDGLVQQRDTQRNAATGSRLDLQTTLERASLDNRRLADLDLQNAKSRLADLQAQAKGSTVRAPAEGIVTRPPAGTLGSQVPPAIEAGVRVTRGQALFSVADTATLIVTGRVDEVDVNRLRLGQAVLIGGDAFPGAPIPGRIVGISAEAEAGQASGRTPSFEVRAAFPGNAGPDRGRIRIGLSARMQIVIGSNPQAIILPIDAIRDPMTNPTVQVRDPRGSESRSRSVTLGATHAQGVEILSGLATGDLVVLP